MRTFIAIELLPDIKKAIGKVIENLKTVKVPVKWVEEENLHITLKFLGEVPEAKLKDLEDTVRKAVKGFKPFQASFEGSGFFPNDKRARVIWIGVKEGNKEMRQLAKNLENAEFTSHVTIGRVKIPGNLSELAKKIMEVRDIKFGDQVVDGITIMKSTLTRKGPIYEAVKRIQLGTCD